MYICTHDVIRRLICFQLRLHKNLCRHQIKQQREKFDSFTREILNTLTWNMDPVVLVITMFLNFIVWLKLLSFSQIVKKIYTWILTVSKRWKKRNKGRKTCVGVVSDGCLWWFAVPSLVSFTLLVTFSSSSLFLHHALCLTLSSFSSPKNA